MQWLYGRFPHSRFGSRHCYKPGFIDTRCGRAITFNLKPSTFNLQPSTLNLKPWPLATLREQPS
ncbi:hypothetical protein [Moorena producens]|uniref:hypothetical protein n=1 Tax=Moorena producens TaxID=1155739 RepID=UPI003C78E6F6